MHLVCTEALPHSLLNTWLNCASSKTILFMRLSDVGINDENIVLIPIDSLMTLDTKAIVAAMPYGSNNGTRSLEN